MTDTPYIDTAAIKALYAPYHTMPAFEFGFNCYGLGIYEHGFKGTAAQAFDRGLEVAMKVQRLADWIKNNVGSN